MSYIRFENICKSFGTNEVLKNIDLEIEKGEMVTLLGPSGCGKSTLLRCLAGLETVTSGTVYLDGRDITNVSPKNRDIGMVFQQYSLFPNMTVRQNVEFGLKVKKTAKPVLNAKVDEMLEIVGLSDKKNYYPSQLSGGQQQRAALARAIVTEPKVLLLDEPLSAIDALLRRNLQIEIRRIQKELGITAVFVTHDQDEAMVMSDHIHLLYQGRIEQSDTPEDLYINPRTAFAASFIGHYNIFSAENFYNFFGQKAEAETIAFRPECIGIDAESFADENIFSAKGTVIAAVLHGNIVRYTVEKGDSKVDVDVLLDHSQIYGAGDSVSLTLKKEDCILL